MKLIVQKCTKKRLFKEGKCKVRINNFIINSLKGSDGQKTIRDGAIKFETQEHLGDRVIFRNINISDGTAKVEIKGVTYI